MLQVAQHSWYYLQRNLYLGLVKQCTCVSEELGCDSATVCHQHSFVKNPAVLKKTVQVKHTDTAGFANWTRICS